MISLSIANSFCEECWDKDQSSALLTWMKFQVTVPLLIGISGD